MKISYRFKPNSHRSWNIVIERQFIAIFLSRNLSHKRKVSREILKTLYYCTFRACTRHRLEIATFADFVSDSDLFYFFEPFIKRLIKENDHLPYTRELFMVNTCMTRVPKKDHDKRNSCARILNETKSARSTCCCVENKEFGKNNKDKNTRIVLTGCPYFFYFKDIDKSNI